MSQPREQRSLLWRFLQIPCRIGTTLLFDFKAYGADNVPAHGGVLIISNHQSYLDPVLLGVQLRRPLSYLAKSELFQNRFFGWLITSLNAFPVRQGAGDVGAVKETIARLHEGHILNIYPEGTRTDTGRMLPIEKGAALVIRRAKTPVVPVAIVGSLDAWPRGHKLFRPRRVRIRYGPAANLSHLRPDEIVRWIDVTLNAMVDELTRDCAAERANLPISTYSAHKHS